MKRGTCPKWWRPVALAAFVVLSGSAVAEEADPCQEKRQAIERQIDEARALGHHHRLAGLGKALAGVRAGCSPASIQQARARDVAEASEKVAERERELQEARAEGKDADKIARREAKLAEARAALQRVQAAQGQ